MRLVTFSDGGPARPGAVVGEDVVDLAGVAPPDVDEPSQEVS